MTAAERQTSLREAIVAQLSRGVVTAAAIAQSQRVSVRTVYRRISDLRASGVRILGEAGVGYLIRQGATQQ